MNIPDKSLYEITGDIKDINTLLVGRAQIEALVRDAERYRWPCSYTIIPAPSLWDNGVGFVTPALPRKSGAMNKQELDTAIDAMQEKQS